MVRFVGHLAVPYNFEPSAEDRSRIGLAVFEETVASEGLGS